MKKIILLIVFGFWGCNATATVLFENSWDTNVSQGLAWCSSCGTSWRTFDTFQLTSDSMISQIDTELYLFNTPAVNYSIWTADRVTELFSQTINIGDLTVLGGGISNNFVSANISGLTLSAGSYALSVWDLANPSSTMGWHASNMTFDSSSVQCFNPLDNFNNCSQRTDQTMRIHGGASVPEPASLAILGLGLAGFGFFRRKKSA